MATPKLTEELNSPRLYAFLIGISGATFGVIVFGLISMIIAAFAGTSPGIFFVHLAAATVVSFFLSYLYGLLRWYKRQLDRQKIDGETLVRHPTISEEVQEPAGSAEAASEFTWPGAKEDGGELDDDFVKIPGNRLRAVRVTDGITVEHLLKLAEANLDAVSQRALDQAGVITRDPSVQVNARVLIEWLNRNGLIELHGNSRYIYTRSGDALLKNVAATRGSAPTTTTLE